MLPSVDDIEQVNCCKLLGVIFQSNLKMDHMFSISYHSVLNECTCGWIFTRDSSKNVKSRKDVPFWGYKT